MAAYRQHRLARFERALLAAEERFRDKTSGS
jgi:hypothetical protein